MQEDSVQNTFNAIKNLPVEIDYSVVEQFVLSQPLTVFINNNSWLNFKNILIMTTSASLIGILLMLNQSDPLIPATASKEQKKEIINKEIVQHAQQSPVQEPLAAAVVLPATRRPALAASAIPETVVINKAADSTPSLADAPLTVTQVEEPTVPASEAPVAAEESGPVATECNPAHGIPCHCKCNDGNNVTCTFKDRLMDDEIIDDSEKFSFKIDSKSFTVNGKEQPENVFKKYTRIYRELTGRKLTEGSYMTVTVEKNNCSISINYNDKDEANGDTN